MVDVVNKRGGRWLTGAAMRSGWGWRLTAEVARSPAAVVGYAVKVARLGAEVTKTSQLPVAAPRGLRRIRSSRGFLGPLRQKTAWTGLLRHFPLTVAPGKGQSGSFRAFAALFGGCNGAKSHENVHSLAHEVAVSPENHLPRRQGTLELVGPMSWTEAREEAARWQRDGLVRLRGDRWLRILG
jgi:hypothetical protein